MQNTTIIGTGLQGLIGSRIVALLGHEYSFENCSRSTGVNIIDKSQVLSAFRSSPASIVIHLAAKADVDGCEMDKAAGEDGEAWKINVVGTEHVIAACKETKKKLIYISTDFVFDGEHPPVGGYTEEDLPRPINWYGVTKRKAEELVLASGLSPVILRPAYPFGQPFVKKKDFVQAIRSRLATEQTVQALTDHIFTPTYIDDLVGVIDHLFRSDQQGIFHTAGSQFLTPYEAALAIADRFGYNKQLINQVTRKEFFAGRASRPYNLSLKNDKIKKLGLHMRTFSDGLAALAI